MISKDSPHAVQQNHQSRIRFADLLDSGVRPLAMKSLIAILLMISSLAFAESPSATTTREIDQLFAALQGSGCEFSRNGSWYDAQKATEHLHRKYDYLLKKGLVTTTESFIERAATESSLSGKPYLVRCGAAQPVPSKSWFNDKLNDLRARSPGIGKS
jgi:hypothetical protein